MATHSSILAWRISWTEEPGGLPSGGHLSGALGVQVDHLEVPEVRLADGVVLRTHVVNVRDTIIVKVIFTGSGTRTEVGRTLPPAPSVAQEPRKS